MLSILELQDHHAADVHVLATGGWVYVIFCEKSVCDYSGHGLHKMLLLPGWAFQRKLSLDHGRPQGGMPGIPVLQPYCPTTPQSVQSTLNIP